MIFAILGAGLDGFYQMTLDEAVRNSARQVQIDGPASSSGANFVASVCTELGSIAPGCQSAVTYAIQGSTQAAGFSSLTPIVLPSSGLFPNSFFVNATYAPNVNVLIQVAYPLPFKIPFFSTLITGTNTSSIVAATTVRVEPF